MGRSKSAPVPALRIRTAYGWITIGHGYILIDNGQGVERIDHRYIPLAGAADDAVAEAVGVAIG